MSSVSIATGPDSIPRLPTGHLPRPHLSCMLLGANYRLRLLCAPAGSGKSRLLRECAQHCPENTVLRWLEMNGQPMTEGALHEWLAEVLGQQQATPDCLGRTLARQRSPLWLMLDDVPLGTDAGFDGALNQLIQHSSAQVGWWVGTRRRPAWPLARLLLAGELCELGAAELALDSPELQQVLDATGERSLLPQVDELLAQTGGWYAGVRLKLLEAANARHREREPDGCLIRSYVERELLDELTPLQRNALCALACLPRFDAELCEYVLEVDGGTALIGELRSRGAFIDALGGESRAYRVQPVIARALVQRLDGAARRAIHRRACQHCSARNLVSEAIDHALLAGEHDVAASLIERLSRDQLFKGNGLASMSRWRGQLSAHLMSGTPRLLILNAWSLLLGGNLEEAERMAGRLSRFLPQPNPIRHAELLAQWLVLAGVITCRRDQRTLGRQLLEDGLKALSERAWAQRVLALGELVDVAHADGREDEAQAMRREAISLSRTHHSLALEGLLVLQRVRLMTSRGELEPAQRLLQRLENDLGEARQPMLGHILLHKAKVLGAIGNWHEATASFEAATRLCLESGDPDAILGFAGLAELDALAGEIPRAFAHLAEAERFMQRQQVDVAFHQGQLTLVRGNLWLRQGNFDRARKLARGWLQDFPMEQGVQTELALRFELLEARAHQGMGEEVATGLEQLLGYALRQGWKNVACEIQVALAEAHHGHGRRRRAQSALLDGLALARQVGMTNVERFLHGGDSTLTGWMTRTRSDFEDAGADTDIVQLSRRELSVLQLIAGGLANQEIAERLHISLHTVKSHAQRINVKLGVSRRTQAILRAKELRLVN